MSTFEFNDAINRAKKIGGFHTQVASNALPNGGILDCDKCGATSRYTSQQCVRFLATGWPQCCGETMKLRVPK